MTKATKRAKATPATLPAIAPSSASAKLGRKVRFDALEPKDAAPMAACPITGAVRVVASAELHTQIGKAAGGDWSDLSVELYRATERIKGGDLGDAERMLFGQAVALQSLFVRLTEGALAAETVPNYDLKFRYALRAQAQCRATLETLAAIKNPPVIFARQANVSNGPQQVNNGIARAEVADSRRNEQSGETIELCPNGRTPTPALAPDSSVAPLGTLDGAENGRGQEQVVAQRMEGRSSRRAARPVQDTEGASARRGRNRRGANGTAPLVSSAD